MIRPLIGGGSSKCKATDENVGKRRCKHLLCTCSSNSLKVINIINKNNGEAYLVGGCVRDMVLKEKPHDEDLTTSLTPDQVTNIFEKEGYKVIPTGLQHGTVTVMIDGEGYEITTFRKDSTYSDGRHPDSVEFSTDVNDDCSRRDFTFNAMYYDGKEIIDTYNGQKDIEDKVIRTVGNPDERFNEDALRMLRAIRFSSKLNFTIAPEVTKSIKKNKSLINKISKERISSELTKTLQGPNRIYAIKELQKTGLLTEIIPEVDNKDLKNKLNLMERCPSDHQIQFAILFDGTDSDSLCRRLKLSNEDRETIVNLSKNIKKPSCSAEEFIYSNQDLSDEEFNKLQVIWNDNMLKDTLKRPHRIKDLSVNGDDLIALGYKGKEVGKQLNKLLKVSIFEHTNNKNKLLKSLNK